MKEEIKNLTDLQAIDLDARKIGERMAAGYGELDQKKAAIVENSKAIEEYKEQLVLGEKRRKELETLIEDEESRIKDRQTKLMNIQTNREYQSILKEIEDTKQANKQRDEELILLLEQAEAIQKRIDDLIKQSEDGETQLLAETKKIETVSAKLEAQKKKIEKTRDAQAKKVNSKYLRRYEMLRERRNGLAMAGVTKGVCLGCNMNIPPQMFNELLREDEMLSCPTCNRMMYHLPEVESEE